MKSKIRIHVIHHTHWDMEWYFTAHDTNSLLNYSLKTVVNKLKLNKDETFLFDGQTAPFEDVPKNKVLFNDVKNLIAKDQLKVGPWYSQPDLRLTSDEGIFRNFHYGQTLGDIKTNDYDYLYTPDTFGFGENIPSIYSALGKKYSVLWRGVNRKAINDEPIFKWKTASGQESIVYNIASGYFVARYLYDDDTLEALYQNNILPSIKRQSKDGKYPIVALPSGGDQQPYNENIKEGIKKLNEKNDGYEYVLSSWKEFFKELDELKLDFPEYEGNHVLSYGGRIHKLVGSHRADIKKLLYRNEMSASRLLEPLLMEVLPNDLYPEVEMDKMWKNVLLSQAHDAYASCNSDIVNRNIKNRLIDSQNILKSNRDLVYRFMANQYENNQIIIFNPTTFKGETTFKLKVATLSKEFTISDNNKDVSFIVEKQTKVDGGVKVVYTADGEIENQKPSVYVSDVILISKVNSKDIKLLSISENKPKQEKYKGFVKLSDEGFILSTNGKEAIFNFNFNLDGGDSYDLDLYDDIDPVSLTKSHIKFKKSIESKGLRKDEYEITVDVPKDMESWIANEQNATLKGKVFFTSINDTKVDIEFSFSNMQKNMLIQPTLKYQHDKNDHKVLTHNGFITRKNVMDYSKEDLKLFREGPSNFDFMHAAIYFGTNDEILISSLDVREYKISDNVLYFNSIRTPDVLGRANLRIRPGRASGLPDRTVEIPDSTSELNNEKISLSIYFDLEAVNPSKLIEEILIQDSIIHKQDLFRYYSSVNTWTLPFVDVHKNISNNIEISNDKVVVQAMFYSKGEFIIRLNNPYTENLTTDVKIFNKVYKNVIIKSYETKEFKEKQ